MQTHTLLLLLLLLKEVGIIKRGCKAGRERLTLYQSEDPNPTTPTHRKKEEKGKTGGDKKALALLLKQISPTPSNTGSLRWFHRDTDKGIQVLLLRVLQRGGA